MIAGIITTPKRQQYLPQLVASVSPYVDKLYIYNDQEMQGHWYNMERLWQKLLKEAKPDEPVLVLDDDMQLSDNWYEDWQKIHAEAQDDTYVLFTRLQYLFKPEAVKQGWTRGQYKRSLYCCATIFINKPTLVEDVLDWFETIGRQTIPIKRQSHFDVVVQSYYEFMNKEYTVATPTLADHIGVQSTLGHQIGGSPNFKGKY